MLFLSDTWADMVKQPEPAIWKPLGGAEKLQAIEDYAERVVRHMAAGGLEMDTFAIGNEIDFGICGVFEEQWPHRVSIDYMRQNVWPRMVPMLKAAEAGVRKAQPRARFIVHLAQWTNPDYCIAFWRAQQEAGVQIDYPGLSYYPSSSDKPAELRFAYLRGAVARIRAALGKPVLICECAYPAAAAFGGQFSTWNHAAEGYALSPAGQARWIADFVALVRRDADFAGACYWSPEWYGGGLWDAFGLFDGQGAARPGVQAFQAPAAAPPGAPGTRCPDGPAEALSASAAQLGLRRVTLRRDSTTGDCVWN